MCKVIIYNININNKLYISVFMEKYNKLKSYTPYMKYTIINSINTYICIILY